MPSRHTATMSDSFFAHGLAGIDTHHAAATRGNATALVREGTPLHLRLRQSLGTLFIASGNLVAGQRSSQSAGEHRLAS